jgi:hypothetical protein
MCLERLSLSDIAITSDNQSGTTAAATEGAILCPASAADCTYCISSVKRQSPLLVLIQSESGGSLPDPDAGTISHEQRDGTSGSRLDDFLRSALIDAASSSPRQGGLILADESENQI